MKGTIVEFSNLLIYSTEYNIPCGTAVAIGMIMAS